MLEAGSACLKLAGQLVLFGQVVAAAQKHFAHLTCHLPETGRSLLCFKDDSAEVEQEPGGGGE